MVRYNSADTHLCPPWRPGTACPWAEAPAAPWSTASTSPRWRWCPCRSASPGCLWYLHVRHTHTDVNTLQGEEDTSTAAVCEPSSEARAERNQLGLPQKQNGCVLSCWCAGLTQVTVTAKSLTAVKCSFEGLDISGHAWDPVDSHFVDSPLLHFLDALADNVRHLGALTPARDTADERCSLSNSSHF